MLDVRRFIDEQPFGRYQLLITGLCAAIVFIDGFDAQIMGFVAPALSAELRIPRVALGTVISSGTFGMMIGALTFGPLADRFGRKPVLVNSSRINRPHVSHLGGCWVMAVTMPPRAGAKGGGGLAVYTSRQAYGPWARRYYALGIDLARPVSRVTARQIKSHTGEEPRIMAKMDTRDSLPSCFQEAGVFVLPTSNGEYVIVKGDQAYLLAAHISPYSHGNLQNHDPERQRRLLLHKREIEKLHVQIVEKGLTIVPLRLYFKGSRVKVEIAVVRGKKQYDKRETEKRREADREAQAAMKIR